MRDAVKTIREPSHLMIQAGGEELQRNSLAGAYKAMIDAALKD